MGSENKSIPLYNSRIIDTYIKLVKNKYSHVNVCELLNHAGMKPYEVADQGHWFTQEQVELFYERLVNLTKNEDIAREAGRYAASSESIGVMRQYFLSLVAPAAAYKMLGESANHFTRSSVYESRRITANKFEISVTQREGIREKKFQCENRMGFFEAATTIFNARLPHIEHSECIFSGGKTCRYIVTFGLSSYDYFIRIRNYSVLFLFALCAVAFVASPKFTIETVIPVSVGIALLLSLLAGSREKSEFKASLENNRDSIDKLIEQINLNYNNASLTSEIGQALGSQTDMDGIFEKVSQVLEERLDYDRGLILLANSDKTKLELQAGYGYSEDQMGLFENISFHLDRPESRGVFIVCYREQRPFLINDFNEIEGDLSEHSLALAKKLGSRSFICCPIISEEKSRGVLAVDNVKSKKPLVQSDMSLLMGIASVIGISLRNAELLEVKERQFKSVLQVLAASIDARDSLTAGHSEKVTEYAVGICNELGVSRDYCEMIRVASLLHDYGKIGVPDVILKKEGKLTEAEYEIVKTHANKTREILEQIHFEGIYREVPKIAASHHEKVDGSGYPQGLKGGEIPLGSKIIAVADYFEAITAKRHYRDPMRLGEAFRILREESGIYFDKKIVEALITYYTKTYPEKTGLSSAFSGQSGPRAPFRTEVCVRVNGVVVPGVSADVSPGGMYVAVDKNVAAGLLIELSIVLPNSLAGMIDANGRVAWVNNKSQPLKPDLVPGFGVEFLEFKGDSQKLYREFISSQMPVDCPQGNQ
ncbi:MAG: HD domain-containing phosphohydrolase [Geobacteraceae bacterium]